MSLYSLSKKLNSIKGKAFNQFILEVSLQKAMELLCLEDMTATEVAYKIGIGNAVFFNKRFSAFADILHGRLKKSCY
jgi:AraC-like DNA-binding protein